MTPLKTAQDLKDIVERAKVGDGEAFGMLYDIYFDRVYGYIYYKVGDPTEAEDLTERVFLKALEAIDKFSWRGVPFSSWLFRIARNLMIDYYRTRSRSTMIPVSDRIQTIDREDPEEIAIRKFSYEKLYAAISRLTEEQQEVIILKFFMNLSNAGIARTLNKTEGAIKALQHRALHSLYRILKGESNDERE
ncbi:MAG: sigma-70 family RNA polymerase sigma factor [Actinomycetota bacterium]